MDTDQGATIAFLGDARTHGGLAVDRIDTHGAVVFLAGDTAYKLKRAVAFPYMDFSTLAKREHACRRELDLNRLTAPQIYRGVLPIRCDGQGRLSMGGDGAVVDWVVVMRRFAQDDMLGVLADRGALTAAIVEDLADEAVTLHGKAPRHPEVGARRFRWVVEENVEELRAAPSVFPAAQVEDLADAVKKALDRAAPVLDARAEAGFVRRCHGDLHLQNAVLIDGRPVLFDAIEFNDAIACVDTWYDWSFLLMDLDHRGLHALASRAFNRYLDLSGDDGALACLPLFLSTRAAVRAKVGASAAPAQTDDDAAAALRAQARAYLDRSVGYLQRPHPRLVAIGGLSGTGKTTLARSLAPDLDAPPGAVILRSDAIRKRQFGVPPETPLPAGAYTKETSARVYAELNHRASAALDAGRTVIADAVFAHEAERAAIAAVAAVASVPFAGLWLQAPLEVLGTRIDARGRDASDADRRVVSFQAGLDIGTQHWAELPAGGSPGTTLTGARNALGLPA